VKEQMMMGKKVADCLRCSTAIIRRFASYGKILHYRLGRQVRFCRSEIEHWLGFYHKGKSAE